MRARAERMRGGNDDDNDNDCEVLSRFSCDGSHFEANALLVKISLVAIDPWTIMLRDSRATAGAELPGISGYHEIPWEFPAILSMIPITRQSSSHTCARVKCIKWKECVRARFPAGS